MPVNVVMPQLDLFMAEGTITTWLKHDGDAVDAQEPVALIETAKIEVELEAPASGTLYTTQPAGATVAVGDTIALILQPGEEVSRRPPGLEAPARPAAPMSSQRAEPAAKRVLASPLAKKLAKEHALDLSHLTGTGPGQVVTKDDVLTYLQAAQRKPADEERIPLTGWRKTMADRMTYSRQTMAQLTTITEADFTDLLQLRETLLTEGTDRIAITAFLVKAVAQALKEYPLLNASLVEGQIVLKKDRNIGVAVAREAHGLIVPVIRRADEKSLFELHQVLRDLIEKARRDVLSLPDVTGGTFTITNVGPLGVTLSTPLINPPESAILGVGAVVKRPVVLDDAITIRSMAYLCLSYDHRFIDGAPAIGFLQRIKQLLQTPHALT